ncbi:MAG: cobalamin B12-binding domain-containing protein [Elusimicrobia bacterium]|nr:cobalamin B12-binding domain-containing protein [Elusimicrobiota bacterium]
MKITLLIPPTSLKKSYGSLKKFSNPQPSIGLAYIASVLEANGYQVEILDAYVGQFSLQEIVERLRRSDVVGISSLSSTADTTYGICEALRKASPKTIIVHGNLHPSVFPDESLDGGRRGDYIVHGEGEETFLELCDHLSGRKKTDLSLIRGISRLRDGRVEKNPPRPFITALDALPYPAWHLFDLSKYSSDPRTQTGRGAKELQILGTRGCPMGCTFCSSRGIRSQGQKYRTRSPENIVAEVRAMHERFGATVFSFMDLAFPLVREHAAEFCGLMVESGLSERVRWVSEMRVKSLDAELVGLMKRAGCARVCFGIESGNDEVLARIGKNFKRSDVIRAVSLCREAGLEADGMFMMGLPGEDYARIDETVDLAVGLGLRFAIFNLFVPYPGCDLYDELKAGGEIRFNEWADFVSYPSHAGGEPVYVPKGMTKEGLMAKQREAMRRFYLRGGFVLQQLRQFRLEHVGHYLSGLKALLFEKG